MTTTSTDIYDRTIHRLLKSKAEQYGNREFFRFNDQVFGFRDLDRESNKIAAGLQRLGVAKGDKVAIEMGNRPEFLFLWFGLCKLGAVEVPINTSHRGDLLSYMINQSDCRFMVVDSAYLDRAAPVMKGLPKIEKVLVLKGRGENLPKLNKPTFDFLEVMDNDGGYTPVDVIWADPYAIMYTSGTTGPSRGALMPHNYAVHMGETVSNAVEYTEKDCLYTVLPLFHGNAQVLSTIPALMNGARMILRERFSAGHFWDDVKKYGCTEFNFIGAILPILFKADPKPDDADNPLRAMLGGGAPMDQFGAIEKRFGVTLIEGYGMSEIGLPLMNTLRVRKSATCGRPLPDYTVKVVDENGVEVGPNVPGELLVRHLKPNCMLIEYYNMPGKTIEAWKDLWFHTGDYLYYDEDGYFHFVDRKKDALRRRGENISSYEVEKVINAHPAVLESAAVAAVSEMGEDEVMVCLRLKPGKKLEPEELMTYCEGQMAYFMIPRYVRYMDELPKTPTERVEKYRLREQGITRDTWDREKAGYKLKK
ncbi:MAG: AMP-binding protein [Candidatus Aminicenantes bacterium]|nr:AMP-binding protein [Candidatus Aminicenantes bacterium]